MGFRNASGDAPNYGDFCVVVAEALRRNHAHWLIGDPIATPGHFLQETQRNKRSGAGNCFPYWLVFVQGYLEGVIKAEKVLTGNRPATNINNARLYLPKKDRDCQQRWPIWRVVLVLFKVSLLSLACQSEPNEPEMPRCRNSPRRHPELHRCHVLQPPQSFCPHRTAPVTMASSICPL